jgi:hypothetical protein
MHHRLHRAEEKKVQYHPDIRKHQRGLRLLRLSEASRDLESHLMSGQALLSSNNKATCRDHHKFDTALEGRC